MSAPSTLLSSLSQRLTANSAQLLQPTGVLSSTVPSPTNSSSLPTLSSEPTSSPSPVDPAVVNTPQPDTDEAKLDLFDSILAEAEQLPPSAQETVQASGETTSSDQGLAQEEVKESVRKTAQEVIQEAAPTQELPQAQEVAQPQVVAQTQEVSPTQEDINPMSASLFASVTPQALPQATEAIWQEAQAQAAQSAPVSTTGKEHAGSAWSLDSAVQESGGTLAAVEVESQPEISPEVESYLQRVEDTQAAPTKELAELIPTVAAAIGPAPTEVVRVLPINKQTAEVGRKKSPKFSVRWLVEWSDKVVLMFKGKVAYQAMPNAQK